MSEPFLPYGRQTIEDDDVAAVAQALRADFLTTGPLVSDYETAFAAATGANHAIALNSGTAALHLAAKAAGLREGDAAVVPSITFLATANAVRMTGAEVVFADVDPDTGLLTAETLRDAVRRALSMHMRPKLALPVHLCGQVCDMADLAAVAREFGMLLVEDACHSLGVANIGATPYSLAACFSTHPVKTIATGEGGVVTTNDAGLAQIICELRSHGIVRDPARFANKDLAFDGDAPNTWYYEMAEIGWNYRLPDILCALGISQLRKLERFHRRRVKIAELYDHLLYPLRPELRPVPQIKAQHGWHLYTVLVDFVALGRTRRRFVQSLHQRGVGTQVHYIPVHRQPYYRNRYGDLHLPGANAYYSRCLSIPLFPSMTDGDVERVATALAASLRS